MKIKLLQAGLIAASSAAVAYGSYRYISLGRWTRAAESSFGKLDKQQKESIQQIVLAFRKYGDGDSNKLAYILATAKHESNFRPIAEHKAHSGRVQQLQSRYWSSGFYGRGFVQLTWKRNYVKMSRFLKVDFVKNPNLALKTYYAAQILVYGLLHGSFTRKKLSRYINSGKVDFYNARRTVNGTDRAAKIAGYARLILNHHKPIFNLKNLFACPYFQSKEFDSKDAPGSGRHMQPLFMRKLCKARKIAKVPFVINSAYRTAAHNKAVGGVSNSSHLRGWAADISTPRGRNRKLILAALRKAGFNRLGVGPNYIHVDCDPTKAANKTWHYS